MINLLLLLLSKIFSINISNVVSMNPKVETPKVKVDMEAKLQAWLESKGKTKSSHRMMAIRSPLIGTNQSWVKKLGVYRSAVAENAKLTSKEQRYPFEWLSLLIVPYARTSSLIMYPYTGTHL